ncbi:hypothetical protein [Ornithinibacillus contaminans]|uniref:hypothetical protein n=1 Tax=Ornithinibacillus contaminans TaxID=694055 RepID=UPI00064D79C8|nr:hypothetical protein [Ornithinibacillus contaminans]
MGRNQGQKHGKYRPNNWFKGNADHYRAEVIETAKQLGKLQDLERESYISELMQRSDTIKFATQILDHLSQYINTNEKLSDKAKELHTDTIEHLMKRLQKKNKLSPMEIRSIYIEIAELRRNIDSRFRFWLLQLKNKLTPPKSTLKVSESGYSRKKK